MGSNLDFNFGLEAMLHGIDTHYGDTSHTDYTRSSYLNKTNQRVSVFSKGDVDQQSFEDMMANRIAMGKQPTAIESLRATSNVIGNIGFILTIDPLTLPAGLVLNGISLGGTVLANIIDPKPQEIGVAIAAETLDTVLESNVYGKILTVGVDILEETKK